MPVYNRKNSKAWRKDMKEKPEYDLNPQTEIDNEELEQKGATWDYCRAQFYPTKQAGYNYMVAVETYHSDYRIVGASVEGSLGWIGLTSWDYNKPYNGWVKIEVYDVDWV